MPTRFQVQSYLRYWLDAVDEHSLHSPFFFDLYTQVIKSKAKSNHVSIEDLRRKLLDTKTSISFQDLGAGSSVLTSTHRTVADIARTSLSQSRFSRMYARLIQYFSLKHCIELGTSLGINALYLADQPSTKLTTFEGVPEIAAYAKSTFEFHGNTNIQLKEGNINKVLPDYLQKSERVDFAFLDANHRYEPTCQYARWIMERMHHKSILVIDDIHSSPDMEKAWNELKNASAVCASADLYRSGMLFFNPQLNKQHVVLQF